MVNSRVLVFAFLACTLACQKTKTLDLPEAPREPTVAFAALYSEEGPSEIGPVVLSATLYSGRYAVEADDSKLSARLFFVEVEALNAAARAACDEITNRLERAACLDRVADCAREPTSCLAAKPKAAGCEDRRPIAAPARTRAFVSDDGEDFSAATDLDGALSGLILCGPSLTQRCPLLLPGYVVTEGAEFRCLAPSTQRGCALDVDLSDCGLGAAMGEVPEQGDLVPTLAVEGCTAEAARPSDLFGGATRGFSVVCGSRRFGASLLEEAFGEVGCTRKGPTVYNDDFSQPPKENWSTRGMLRAMKWTHLPGWTPRLIFDGTGTDGCACPPAELTTGCESGCLKECNEFVSLPDCANANTPHPCRQTDASENCRARCRAACDAGLSPSVCRQTFSGHQLQLAADTEPERGLVGSRLGDEMPVTQVGSLVVLARNGAAVLALGLLDELRFFTTTLPDTFAEDAGARTTPLTFQVAGLVPSPTTPDEMIAFGRTNTAPITGTMAVFRAGGTPLVVERLRTAPLQLPTADGAVIAGPARDRVLAISLQSPEGASSPAVRVVATVGVVDGATSTVQLEGRPTAIGSGPSGEAWVGFVRDSGVPGIAVLGFDGSAVKIAQVVDLPIGLVPVAFFADARACDAGACRTHVGFEQPASDPEAAPALVGALEYAPGAPERSRMTRTFVTTGSAEISFFEYDPEADVLYAVASRSNRLTPISLLR